jgi:hypothetical protein
MRNPARQRNLAIAWMLISLAFVGLGVWVHGRWGKPGQAAAGAIWTLAGFAAVTFFILAWIAQVETMRYRRLLRGADELARWRVSESEWRAFVALAERFNATVQPGVAGWTVEGKDDPGPGGVEVIFGRASVAVGDDFETLPERGSIEVWGPAWVEGPPAFLEFGMRMPAADDTTTTRAIRVPVAAGAEAEARAVMNYYQRRGRAPVTGKPLVSSLPAGPARPRRGTNWRLRRDIGALMAVVGALAFAVAWTWLEESKQSRDGTFQAWVMTGLIAGVMMVPAGLLIAVVCHLRARRAAATRDGTD